MFKRILTGFLALIVLLAICEAVGLGILYVKAGSTERYWHNRQLQAGELVYIALGDSAAQGVGSSDPSHSYVSRIADSIAATTGRKVKVYNISVTGATVHDVLTRQVPMLEKYGSTQPTPFLVTLDVGANDVNHAIQSTPAFRKDYETILQALPPGRSVVSDVPYFGGRIRADDRVRQANDTIRELAGTYKIPVAPLYDTLKPRQSPWIYAADFFHPNDRGYALWHDAFWQRVEPIVDAQRSTPLPVTDQPIPLPPPSNPQAQ